MSRELRSETDTSEIEEALRDLEISHQATGRAILKLKNKLSKKQNTAAPVIFKAVTIEECKQLIGRQVKVLNPKKGESEFGFIQAVGTRYITLGIPGTKDRRRIAKNIRLVEHGNNR